MKETSMFQEASELGTVEPLIYPKEEAFASLIGRTPKRR
jgi:hypothetical protein